MRAATPYRSGSTALRPGRPGAGVDRGRPALDPDVLRGDPRPGVPAADQLLGQVGPVGRGVRAAADVEPLDDQRAARGRRRRPAGGPPPGSRTPRPGAARRRRRSPSRTRRAPPRPSRRTPRSGPGTAAIRETPFPLVSGVKSAREGSVTARLYRRDPAHAGPKCGKFGLQSADEGWWSGLLIAGIGTDLTSAGRRCLAPQQHLRNAHWHPRPGEYDVRRIVPSNEHSTLGQKLSHASKSRALMIVLATVVVLAVAGTTWGYSSLSKSVTLSLDGKSEQVTAFGGTVGDVLDSEGVEVGARDERPARASTADHRRQQHLGPLRPALRAQRRRQADDLLGHRDHRLPGARRDRRALRRRRPVGQPRRRASTAAA